MICSSLLFRQVGPIIHRSCLSSVTKMATSTIDKLDLEAFGKAASGSGSPSSERGDCPFSQRVYIELEEKNVPYKATYIEEGDNKPDWFMEKNPSGLMPVLRDGERWIQDSDKIVQHLEDKFPQPSLKTPDDVKQQGAGVFPAFTNWLKSKDPSDSSKKQFIDQLAALNEHLTNHGPYIAGDRPTDADFALAPKLRHTLVALRQYMNFQLPDEFSAVNTYTKALWSRPSFQKTDSPDEMIIEGWRKKYDLPEKIAQPQAAR